MPIKASLDARCQRSTERLVRLCRRHWFLQGGLPRLYRWAERRGYAHLVREHGLRLLAEAHVQRLREQADPGRGQALARTALDRFEWLALRGDPEAAWQVAEAHRTGFGRPGNHWMALTAYQRAADLGHPEAALRRQQVEARLPVQDDTIDRWARQALLRATYRPPATQRAVARLWAAVREGAQHGFGRRFALTALGLAGALAVYMPLDFYFFGLGHWRPDPTRVAWGLVGPIHPPRDASASRTIPAWLRPEVSSAAFDQIDFFRPDQSRVFTLEQMHGRVVLLHVVDGDHPLLFAAQQDLDALRARFAGQVEVLVIYLPGLAPTRPIRAWVQELSGFQLCVARDPRLLRPLGSMRQFPMTYVLDRRGRVRQRWVGFSAALNAESLAGALAEP